MANAPSTTYVRFGFESRLEEMLRCVSRCPSAFRRLKGYDETLLREKSLNGWGGVGRGLHCTGWVSNISFHAKCRFSSCYSVGHLAPRSWSSELISNIFHTVDCFWNKMYPYGEEQNDTEMDVGLIRDELCKEVLYDYGIWFFDDKHYVLYVSIMTYSSLCWRGVILIENQQSRGPRHYKCSDFWRL